jgi:cytoskeletal protein CcmA (bactofilin family)
MNLNNLTGSNGPDNGTSSKHLLGSDIDIKGTLKFETELNFDGKLEGEIISDGGSLTVGENAHVRGELKAKSIVVYGTVTGNITVAERCELKSSAELNGDLKAARMIIEEGAIFIGKSEVTPKSKADRAGSVADDFARKISPISISA